MWADFSGIYFETVKSHPSDEQHLVKPSAGLYVDRTSLEFHALTLSEPEAVTASLVPIFILGNGLITHRSTPGNETLQMNKQPRFF